MWEEKSGDIRNQSPTWSSQHIAKLLRIPASSRQDFSRESGNGSRGAGEFDGYLEGHRDEHLPKFSFSEGLLSLEAPSMKFHWENLLGGSSNLNGYRKPSMNCASGYGADISKVDTGNGYTGNCFPGLVPRAMSMVNERAKAFLPSSSDSGPTKVPGHVDGKFSSSIGSMNVGLHKENSGRFSSLNVGPQEYIPIGACPSADKLLGKEVDEGISSPDYLSVGKLPARELYQCLQTGGHSLAGKLSARESHENIQIQDYLLAGKPSARESHENIHIQDHHIADKPLARVVYKEEEKGMFHPRQIYHHYNEEEKSSFYKMDSHHMIPLAQSKVSSAISTDDFGGPYKHSSTFPSDEFKSRKTNTEPFGCGRDGQMPSFRYPAKPELSSRWQAQLSPTESKPWDHPESWRSERGDLGKVPDEFYRKMASTEQDYDHHDFVDSVEDRIHDTENSYRCHMRNRRLPRYPLELPIHKYLDARKMQYGIGPQGEDLGSRSTHLDFETEEYEDCENMRQEEGYGFERDDSCSYKERLPVVYHDPAIDINPKLNLTAEVPFIHDPSENILRRKCSMEKKISKRNCRSKLSKIWKTSTMNLNLSNKSEGWASENVDELFLSRRSVCSHSSHNVSGVQNRLSQPYESCGRNIKDQWGPASQNIHASRSLVRGSKLRKFLKRGLDDSHGSHHVEGISLKAKVNVASNELPEGSEQFKQQVHSLFLKFVKLLNENAAQRRIYMEQGKTSSLKCSICGRNSKEFASTMGLVMHSAMSPIVGLRAQHLGLFKALCLLMGWNSEMTPNKPWFRQVLPDAEALALKEDIIIWPPVVIFHNSSIGNNDPSKRMIVTIDMLANVLRDLGFDEGETKISRGKPANQSIMVVRFNGTFSGLQRAEKLHNIYAENKQGRAEFQQINCNSSRENGKAQVDKVEHVLYGYLGIAGDLEKLDFEAKERCVVKSKKEICAIADALVNE